MTIQSRLPLWLVVVLSGPMLACVDVDGTADGSPSPLVGYACGEDIWVSPRGSDFGAGTRASPFATIGKAVTTLCNGHGATVHVQQGTYVITGSLSCKVSANICSNKSGASSSARVRFVSEPRKWSAVIVGSNADALWNNYGNYVEIDGFEMRSAAGYTTGRYGLLDDASVGYDLIKNNSIHDVGTGRPCDGTGGGGIIIDEWYLDHDKSANTDVIGNRIYNIGNQSLRGSCWTFQGIYAQAGYGKIQNNIVNAVMADGISLWHAPHDLTISNNLVFNCNSGIGIGAGDHPSSSPGTIYYAENNIVNNNLLIGNNYGIIESGYVQHNTYANNHYYADRTNFYCNPTSPGSCNAARSDELTSDPLMVNYQSNGTGDYHLTSSSPDRDSATSTGAPSTDFDGMARPSGGADDRGPYEYGGGGGGVVDLDAGRVVQWTMNAADIDASQFAAEVRDISGHANHGDWQNQAGSSTVTGRVGAAIQLDGTNDKVVEGSNGSIEFGTGDFSVVAWFFLDSNPSSWASIVNKGGSGSTGWGIEISDTRQFTASINGSGGTNQHVGGTATAVTTGQWYHGVAVFDRDNKIIVYLNGLEKINAPYAAGNTNTVSNTSAALTAGAYSTESPLWQLPGKLDDVRLYDRALSASEVAALYHMAYIDGMRLVPQ